MAALGLFAAVCRLPLAAVGGSALRCGARASHCSGFSCCRVQAPGTWASVVEALGLSSCGGMGLGAPQNVESSWAGTRVPCIGRQILIH